MTGPSFILVSSWDGCDASTKYSMSNRDDGERAQDEWDEEYDAGKVEKRKITRDNDSTNRSVNAFQQLQGYRNYTKVIIYRYVSKDL